MNTIKTVVYETGEYQGYCAEFCGVAHSQMTFTMDVRTPQAYQSWLQEQTSGSGNNSSNGSGTATPSGDLNVPVAVA